jgi:hypothetical protein
MAPSSRPAERVHIDFIIKLPAMPWLLARIWFLAAMIDTFPRQLSGRLT